MCNDIMEAVFRWFGEDMHACMHKEAEAKHPDMRQVFTNKFC